MECQFDEQLACATRAELKTFTKGEKILSEGECSSFFYFLKEGELSVANFTEDGKEFLQHRVLENHFFGEPAVLLRKPFPGNVEVCSKVAKVYKIPRDCLLEYLKQHPDLLLSFTYCVAEKSLRKSVALKNIVFLNPEERILRHLLDYKKEQRSLSSKIQINLTRKELSHMTGLRIETIIRTVKKMERDGKLEIRNGKIFV